MIKLDFKKIIGYFICCDDNFSRIKLLRDWKVVLIGFFVGLVVLFLAGGYLYLDYQKESISGLKSDIEYPKRSISLKKDSLKIIFYDIERKEKSSEEIIANPPAILDPSLPQIHGVTGAPKNNPESQ